MAPTQPTSGRRASLTISRGHAAPAHGQPTAAGQATPESGQAFPAALEVAAHRLVGAPARRAGCSVLKDALRLSRFGLASLVTDCRELIRAVFDEIDES